MVFRCIYIQIFSYDIRVRLYLHNLRWTVKWATSNVQFYFKVYLKVTAREYLTFAMPWENSPWPVQRNSNRFLTVLRSERMHSRNTLNTRDSIFWMQNLYVARSRVLDSFKQQHSVLYIKYVWFSISTHYEANVREITWQERMTGGANEVKHNKC